MLTGLLFGAALLSVFRAFEGHLWYVAVAVTEYGYWLVPVALALAVPWARGSSPATSVVALVAGALLASTVLRAAWFSSTVEAKSSGWAAPRSLPGAPASTSPLQLSRLISVPVGPFQARTTEYAPGLRAKVFTRADAPEPRPLVVVVHGGSWASGDETQLEALNGYLAARGYAVVAITYRLAPEHRFPEPVEDVKAAVAWARALPGVDAQRTVLLGRSAGGHLVLQAATELGDTRGVVAFYAPSDLVWSWNHPSNPWVLDSPRRLGDFLGAPMDGNDALYEAASPIGRADRLPPALLLHGTRDELVFAEQSRRLARRLAALGSVHGSLELPWATHGFDANLGGPGGQASTYAIERFLASVTR